ncbi:Protein related to pac2 [Mycena indigotica]|uniref:Protein related to pac2 n=1 Tax=Mycena indigotica TaxID=2126181 RepID=A0A8H6VVM2_9AGAR|nr:Protein related to pac2 [Mycena indigotica]KAF7293566.1 Protein related to pac2 [Mycena indigotica]
MLQDASPYFGHVSTTADAFVLIRLAQEGKISRITRRINIHQLKFELKSGAVFIFSPGESKIQRWYDGLSWSGPTTIGNFVFQREVIGRKDQAQAASRETQFHCLSKEGFNFKPNGLIKKMITMTVEETEYRVISYYAASDCLKGELNTSFPSTSVPMNFRLIRNDLLNVELRFERNSPSLSPYGNTSLFEIESTIDPSERQNSQHEMFRRLSPLRSARPAISRKLNGIPA